MLESEENLGEAWAMGDWAEKTPGAFKVRVRITKGGSMLFSGVEAGIVYSRSSHRKIAMEATE